MRNNPDCPSVSRIHAPYNFVPLSAWIHFPGGDEQISQDMPFRDGICGCFEITLTNHTPLMVGGTQERESKNGPRKVAFFQLPNGKRAIPGSSIRGMVRNVLEIASFGKMGQVDDQVLSIRDLTRGANEIYQSIMTDGVQAGFLRLEKKKDKAQWIIRPQEFVKVEQSHLISFAKNKGKSEPEKIRLKNESELAAKKYHHWKGLPLVINFSIDDKGYGRLKKDGKPCGRIVFTGQPANSHQLERIRGKGKPKHREFIFYPPENGPLNDLKVESTMEDFLQIHGGHDRWKFWLKEAEKEPGIPVFFHTQKSNEKQIKSIGLAQMYHLPYTKTIGEAVTVTNPHHSDRQKMDLAEQIFGIVSENNQGLRGRVQFGHMIPVSEIQTIKLDPLVLNGPKPSYFPNYIHQPGLRLKGDEIGTTKTYRTLMDEKPEIRGWKRYPARPQLNLQKPNEDNTRIQSQLFPVDSGAVFQGKIRVHNLRPHELGALLWVLTWGGNPKLRHGLGMGKPYGLGSVTITLDHNSWKELRCNHQDAKLPTPEDCINLFTRTMEDVWLHAVKTEKNSDHAPMWAESEQLAQLRAMADPDQAPGQPESLDYMQLCQFAQAKGKAKGDPHLALLPYLSFKGLTDHDLFLRRTRQEWKDHLEKIKQQAEQEAQRAHLPPELRILCEDLLEDNHLEHAARWVDKLSQFNENLRQSAAQILRDHYQKHGKWSGKLSPKQKAKIKVIEDILAST